MFILYDILFAVYVVLCIPVLFFQGKWHSGFGERLGVFPNELRKRLAGAS